MRERGINEQGGGGRERDREKERRVASLQRVALWHSPLTGSGTSGGGDSLSNNALSIVALNAKGKWSAATLPSLSIGAVEAPQSSSKLIVSAFGKSIYDT